MTRGCYVQEGSLCCPGGSMRCRDTLNGGGKQTNSVSGRKECRKASKKRSRRDQRRLRSVTYYIGYLLETGTSPRTEDSASHRGLCLAPETGTSPRTGDFALSYSRKIFPASQAFRISSGQMLAWTSPTWTRPRSSMHRRLWPMPPPMV